jgi:hypothetical protein
MSRRNLQQPKSSIGRIVSCFCTHCLGCHDCDGRGCHVRRGLADCSRYKILVVSRLAGIHHNTVRSRRTCQNSKTMRVFDIPRRTSRWPRNTEERPHLGFSLPPTPQSKHDRGTVRQDRVWPSWLAGPGSIERVRHASVDEKV